MLKSAYKSFILEAKVGFKVVDKDTRTDHNKRLVHRFDCSAKLVRPLDMTVSTRSANRSTVHFLKVKLASHVCLLVGRMVGWLVSTS